MFVCDAFPNLLAAAQDGWEVLTFHAVNLVSPIRSTQVPIDPTTGRSFLVGRKGAALFAIQLIACKPRPVIGRNGSIL